MCLCVLLPDAVALTTAAELLATVPASALGLVVVNRPAGTLAAARQLAGHLQLPIPDPPGMFGAWLNASEGVDDRGCMAIVIQPAEDGGPPRPILFVAVKDYARFLRQFESIGSDTGISTVEHRHAKFLLRQVDRYAVLALPEHRAALEQIGKGPAIAAELADWQPWLAQNDLSIVVSRQGAQQAGAIARRLGTSAADSEAISMIAKQFARIGLAARTTEAGDVQLALHILPVPGSPAAELLPQFPALDESPLKLLPAAPMDAAMSCTVPGTLAASAMKAMTRGMISRFDAAKAPPEEIARMVAISEQIVKGVRSVSLLLQTARQGDANFFINVLAVYRAENARAMLDRYEQYFRALTAMQKEPASSIMGIVAKRTQFDGLPALEIAIDLSSLERQLSITRSKLIADFFGPDGEPSMWLVAVDDHTVLSGQFRRDLLRRGIGALGGKEPGLATDRRVAAMAEKLPGGASLTGFWNPTGSMVSLKRRGRVPEAVAMPSDPAAASLVGVAAKVSGSELKVVAVVPEGVWKALGQLKAGAQRSPTATTSTESGSSVPPGRTTSAQPAKPSSGRASQSTRSIAGALIWLARHQAPDGHWSSQDYTDRCRDKTCTGQGELRADVEATATALLAFLAAGQTYDKKGPYQATVRKGLQWLMRQQKADGNLSAGATPASGIHGLATLALCEIYGRTKDPAIRPAVQQAVRFLELSSAPAAPVPDASAARSNDPSALGWRLLALKSAEAVGLNVDAEKSRAVAKELINDLGTPEEASLSAEKRDPRRMAVILLAQQHLKAHGSDVQTAEAVRCLLAHLPGPAQQDLRYRFFASLAMQNAPNADRRTWNNTVAKAIVLEQSKDAQTCANGSWSPEAVSSDAWARHSGRLMVTAIQTLSLETYFRYLFVASGEPASQGKTPGESKPDGAK